MKQIINKIKKNIIPIKFVLSSGISFLIDQFLFFLFTLFLNTGIFIIVSKILARAISSLFNYMCNSRFVFKNKSKNAIIKYYSLVIIQALVSSFLIYLVKLLLSNLSLVLISVCIDIIIFVINYFIQKELIFK